MVHSNLRTWYLSFESIIGIHPTSGMKIIPALKMNPLMGLLKTCFSPAFNQFLSTSKLLFKPLYLFASISSPVRSGWCWSWSRITNKQHRRIQVLHATAHLVIHYQLSLISSCCPFWLIVSPPHILDSSDSLRSFFRVSYFTSFGSTHPT